MGFFKVRLCASVSEESLCVWVCVYVSLRGDTLWSTKSHRLTPTDVYGVGVGVGEGVRQILLLVTLANGANPSSKCKFRSVFRTKCELFAFFWTIASKRVHKIVLGSAWLFRRVGGSPSRSRQPECG